MYLHVFASKGNDIFDNRLRLAAAAQTYLCYRWQFSDCLALSLRPLLVVTSDLAVVEAVLQDPTNWEKNRLEPTPLEAISSLACTLMNGEDSVRQRHVLSAAMRDRRQHVFHIERVTRGLCDRLQPGNGAVVDTLPLLSDAALRLVLNLVFDEGAETDALRAAFLPFWDVVRTNKLRLSATGLLEREQRVRQGMLSVRAALDSLIALRRRLAVCRDASSHVCILDKLIERTVFEGEASPAEGPALSQEELVHNLHNMITAAFETTAHSLAAALFHLARAPGYQRLLVERDTSAEQRKELMRWTVKESLRLLPPVLQVSRSCVKAAEVGALRCPHTTTVAVDIAALHRSPHWGSDAHEFNPYRWKALAEAASDDCPSRRWMPFGRGLKGCLGQALALQISESVLLGLLAEFHFELTADFVPDFEQTPTIRFTAGLPLRVTRRRDGEGC